MTALPDMNDPDVRDTISYLARRNFEIATRPEGNDADVTTIVSTSGGEYVWRRRMLASNISAAASALLAAFPEAPRPCSYCGEHHPGEPRHEDPTDVPIHAHSDTCPCPEWLKREEGWSPSEAPAVDVHTCDSTTTVAGCQACQSAKAKHAETERDTYGMQIDPCMGAPGGPVPIVKGTCLRRFIDEIGDTTGTFEMTAETLIRILMDRYADCVENHDQLVEATPRRAPILRSMPFRTSRHTMDDPRRPNLVVTRMVDGTVRVQVTEQGDTPGGDRELISVVV